MSAIRGEYFDGQSSRRVAAELHATDELIYVSAGDTELQAPVSWADVEVSSRIGDTPRYLRFSNDAKFETRDNAAIDALMSARKRGHGLLHRLESRLRYVALGFATVVAFSWAVVQFGIPAFAERVAFALPTEVSEYMDEQVLEMLDKHFLSPTTLSEAEQQRLRATFAPVIQNVDKQYEIRVEFRSAANSIGPNALALPSGTIVFTDELVRLAAGDEELIAVLAHEIGHVVQRHGLRHVIQGSALSALVVVVVGDVSSVSSMVTAMPVLLTELGYSRDFEREADAHSVRTMLDQGLDPEALGRLLTRLDKHVRCGQKNACDTRNEERWGSYLSTHPPTPERVEWARKVAAERS